VKKLVSGYNGHVEYFIADPDVKRLLPVDTRIIGLLGEPYPDGKRLRVTLDLTPFQQNPYLELTLTDSAGEVVAATSIVEPVSWRLDLNLHIRKSGTTSDGIYKLTVILSYPDLGEIDRHDLNIEIPSPME